MLIILPCLIPTGGINVVVNMAKILQKIGYQIDLVSKDEGNMREAFEELGIKVEIRQNIEESITSILHHYSQVFVNNLQMYGIINKLNGTNVDVKWWIHEPPCYFKEISSNIPQKFWNNLKENVTVFSAGNIVHNYILQNFQKESIILNFGVLDSAKTVQQLEPGIISPDKITFLLPSITFQWIKGQDILALAIEGLPEEYQKRTEFLFVGEVIKGEEEFFRKLASLAYGKENVKFFKIMEKNLLLSVMKEADCIVAPSREDATNSCIVEGLMLSKLCLCSNMTGVSYYMQDCVNGFVFPSSNVEELKARIMLIADNFDKLEVIARNGRKVYEENFSMEVFEKNIRKYWAEDRN